ncbi:hypothetical protein PAXINDRAFT_11088 [Paxillus involutus ATCC 200175]|nr:hypothetical protein PAXINDRAFT_11088 [Paxillus involutus ATCC 200175]
MITFRPQMGATQGFARSAFTPTQHPSFSRDLRFPRGFARSAFTPIGNPDIPLQQAGSALPSYGTAYYGRFLDVRLRQLIHIFQNGVRMTFSLVASKFHQVEALKLAGPELSGDSSEAIDALAQESEGISPNPDSDDDEDRDEANADCSSSARSPSTSDWAYDMENNDDLEILEPGLV